MTDSFYTGKWQSIATEKPNNRYGYQVVAPNGTTYKRGGDFSTFDAAIEAGWGIVEKFMANSKIKHRDWWLAPRVGD